MSSAADSDRKSERRGHTSFFIQDYFHDFCISHRLLWVILRPQWCLSLATKTMGDAEDLQKNVQDGFMVKILQGYAGRGSSAILVDGVEFCKL